MVFKSVLKEDYQEVPEDRMFTKRNERIKLNKTQANLKSHNYDKDFHYPSMIREIKPKYLVEKFVEGYKEGTKNEGDLQ